MQVLEFLDPKSGERLDPAGYGDLVAGNGRGKLPTRTEWQRVTKLLQERVRMLNEEIGQSFEKRRRELLQEQKGLDPETPGVGARGRWIEELWTLDERQSQYQVLEVIVSEERK